MSENTPIAHNKDNSNVDTNSAGNVDSATINIANTENIVGSVSYTELTRNFYRAFSQKMPPSGTEASLDESVISEDRLHLKMNLIAEEFVELVEAVYGKKSAREVRRGFRNAVQLDEFNRDVVEAADATADLRVVLDGFDIEAAIPTEAVVEEVFRSNMSKLDSKGYPIISDGSGNAPLGKILKSDNYFPPNVAAILKNNRAQ